MDKITYKGEEHLVRFRHERNTDENGNLLQRGGKTVAYIVLARNSEGKPTKTLEAHATCSKKDVYCKKMGCTIAVGRLRKTIENDSL